MSLIAQIFRIIIVGRMIQLHVRVYFRKVILPILFVFTVSVLGSVFIYYTIHGTTLWQSSIVIFLTILITIVAIVTVGLTSTERQLVFDKLKILWHNN